LRALALWGGREEISAAAEAVEATLDARLDVDDNSQGRSKLGDRERQLRFDLSIFHRVKGGQAATILALAKLPRLRGGVNDGQARSEGNMLVHPVAEAFLRLRWRRCQWFHILTLAQTILFAATAIAAAESSAGKYTRNKALSWLAVIAASPWLILLPANMGRAGSFVCLLKTGGGGNRRSRHLPLPSPRAVLKMLCVAATLSHVIAEDAAVVKSVMTAFAWLNLVADLQAAPALAAASERLRRNAAAATGVALFALLPPVGITLVGVAGTDWHLTAAQADLTQLRLYFASFVAIFLAFVALTSQRLSEQERRGITLARQAVVLWDMEAVCGACRWFRRCFTRADRRCPVQLPAPETGVFFARPFGNAGRGWRPSCWLDEALDVPLVAGADDALADVEAGEKPGKTRATFSVPASVASEAVAIAEDMLAEVRATLEARAALREANGDDQSPSSSSRALGDYSSLYWVPSIINT
jgi:hypothetical protein